jgi:hypothetical protein
MLSLKQVINWSLAKAANTETGGMLDINAGCRSLSKKISGVTFAGKLWRLLDV